MPVHEGRRVCIIVVQQDIRSKEVVGGGLNAITKECCLCLGVGDAKENLLGQSSKGLAFLVEELGGIGKATDRLSNET